MARKKPKDSGVKPVEESSPSSSGQPSAAAKTPAASFVGNKSVMSRVPPAGPKKDSLKTGKGVHNEVLLEQVVSSSSEEDSEDEGTGGVSPASSDSEDSAEAQRGGSSPVTPATESLLEGKGASNNPVVGSGSLPVSLDGAAGSVKGDAPDKPSFASLFWNNRDLTQGFRLEHIPADKEVTILAEDRLELEKEWGYCLVGVFTGRFPGMKAVEGLLSQWGVACKLIPREGGWLVFRFESDQARTSVLAGGPYVLYGKTLMLKTLAPGFSFNFKDFMAMPLWIKLPNVPLDLWTDKGLSKIGSMVGKPICSDLVTTQRARVGYARLLVKVDVSKRLVTNFDVLLLEGICFNQQVVYETYPSYCCDCRHFGHNVFICKKTSPKPQRWIPKGKSSQPAKARPPPQGTAHSGATAALEAPTAPPPSEQPQQASVVLWMPVEADPLPTSGLLVWQAMVQRAGTHATSPRAGLPLCRFLQSCNDTVSLSLVVYCLSPRMTPSLYTVSFSEACWCFRMMWLCAAGSSGQLELVHGVSAGFGALLRCRFVLW
ncbi:hypothetical protein K2173_010097 [Erythroxylum novogranatense]|uniref:DUF4283 domain-containing protein n=1 Tax=Erythroxylum novogranatense TaxID=1862640 RepID=A0AAV8SBT0_9ROSI|nr:hypothetical protein K2173_010097 [Erythroxylum novogranatense]